MKHIHTSLLSIALTGLALGACNGDDAETPDALFADLNAALCENLVTCNVYPDTETCVESSLEGQEELADLNAAIAAGTVVYDSGSGAACLDAFRDFNPCSLDFLAGDGEDIEAACDAVFVGQVELGGTCYLDEECADRGECDADCPDACCSGVCVAPDVEPPRAEIGDPCESVFDCVNAAYCAVDLATGDGTCAARVPLGQPCDDPFACEAGSACDLDFLTLMGTCIVLPAEGEACNPDSFVGCNRLDLTCDEVDSICKTAPGVGDTCDPTSEFACVEYAECVDGTCAALPSLGDSCAELDCLGDLVCDSGVCAAPPPRPVCGPPA